MIAEEFCNEYLGFEQYPTDVPYFMIEFAKYHVQEALRAASRGYWETATQGSNSIQGYYDDILNAYPLENIN